MSPKTAVLIGVTVGSTLGGYLPSLWGGSLFSVSGVVLSTLGGAVGLFISYQLVKE